MSNLLTRIEAYVGKIELGIIVAMMLVMLVAVSSNVLSRAFPSLLPNLDDLSMMAMAVCAFVGAAYSTYSLNHICIELLPSSRNKNLAAFCKVVEVISLLVFSLVFTYLSWGFFSTTYQFSEESPDLGLPLAIPTGAFYFSSVAMGFHTLMEIGRLFSCVPARLTLVEGAHS